MIHLINKSALVAEINQRIEDYKSHKIDDSYHDGLIFALEDLRDDFINTLEVKEVDLEKYYHDFLQKEWFDKNCSRTISEMMAFTAKHFFELGMQVSNKAQKGE